VAVAAYDHLKRRRFPGWFEEREEPYLSGLLFGVYIAYGSGALLTKSQAMVYMGIVDPRTAQRYLRIAQDKGLVELRQSSLDQRVDLLLPTQKLLGLVEEELERVVQDSKRILEAQNTGSKEAIPMALAPADSSRPQEEKRSLAKYTEVISFFPDNAMAYCNRANAHWKSGEPEKALEDLTRSIELEPHRTDYLEMRAQMYEQLGNRQAVLADLTSLIEIAGDDPQIYHRRALFFLEAQEYERAAEDLGAAITATKDRGEEQSRQLVSFYLLRAQIFERLGRRQESDADVQAARRISPIVGILNTKGDKHS
jgi:tetratricopeptide (TPR) repeat protein